MRKLWLEKLSSELKIRLPYKGAEKRADANGQVINIIPYECVTWRNDE